MPSTNLAIFATLLLIPAAVNGMSARLASSFYASLSQDNQTFSSREKIDEKSEAAQLQQKLAEWTLIDHEAREVARNTGIIYYELSEYLVRYKTIFACKSHERIGQIEFDTDDCSIDSLEVKPQFRKQGIATNLLQLARPILAKEYPYRSISFTAQPFENEVMSKEERTKRIDGLITFYRKNGAVLLSKKDHSASMEFPPLSATK